MIVNVSNSPSKSDEPITRKPYKERLPKNTNDLKKMNFRSENPCLQIILLTLCPITTPPNHHITTSPQYRITTSQSTDDNDDDGYGYGFGDDDDDDDFMMMIMMVMMMMMMIL